MKLRTLKKTLLALVLTGGGLLSQSANAVETVSRTQIIAKHSGYLLIFSGTAINFPLQQRVNLNSNTQQFDVVMNGSIAKFINVASGLCVTSIGAATATGTSYKSYPCSGRADQNFHISKATDGTYEIRSFG
ncbi:MAG: RICIN domain-containing protein, partial [Bdellovibrionota bacterium]